MMLSHPFLLTLTENDLSLGKTSGSAAMHSRVTRALQVQANSLQNVCGVHRVRGVYLAS